MDVLAVSDPQLSAAVRFIREHACERIRVEDARKVAALPRTVFERRFRRLLGCAPYEQILKVRLAKANELLALTNLTQAVILRPWRELTRRKPSAPMSVIRGGSTVTRISAP
ncbi:MAG: hypothetical protein ACYDC1_05765, partial [Limisphaerales bacterium]